MFSRYFVLYLDICGIFSYPDHWNLTMKNQINEQLCPNTSHLRMNLTSPVLGLSFPKVKIRFWLRCLKVWLLSNATEAPCSPLCCSPDSDYLMGLF